MHSVTLDETRLNALLESILDELEGPLDGLPAAYQSGTDAKAVALSLLIGFAGSYAANHVPTLVGDGRAVTREELDAVYKELLGTQLHREPAVAQEVVITSIEQRLPKEFAERRRIASDVFQAIDGSLSYVDGE